MVARQLTAAAHFPGQFSYKANGHGRAMLAPQRVEKPPSARQTPPIRGSRRLHQRGERCPVGAEGENLAIARNISGSRTVLSPTACGRSPLAEGAEG